MTGRMKLFLGGLAVVFGVSIFALLFWRLPWWMDNVHLREKNLQPADGVVIASVRTGLVALGATFIAGLGLFYTHITLKHTRRRDREEADLTREGQVTDRYVEAIKLLADKETTKCLGGIYALERIMKDSEKDHPTVVEVLAAFIRDRSPLLSEPRGYTDGDRPSLVVQAALTVIGRRPVRPEKNQIDLSRVDLRGADLTGGYFVGLNFSQSDLRGADCSASHLHGVSFRETILDDACFVESLMDKCLLIDAKGSGMIFDSADLSQAWFNGCEFSQVNFSGADLWASYWSGASIHDTNFEMSDLRFSMIASSVMRSSNFRRVKWDLAKIFHSDYPDSDFRDSSLDRAILGTVDLSEAKGIEVATVGEAMIGPDVKLPKGLSEDRSVMRRIEAYDQLAVVPMARADDRKPQCCADDATLSHEAGLMHSIPSDEEREHLVREVVKEWSRGVGISDVAE